jgi:hypothetical protein
MSLETDFVVASEEQLGAAFPAWVPPKPEPTKENTWVPPRPFPKSGKSPSAIYKAEMAAFQKLPHAQFKGVDPVKLGTLQAILGGGQRLLGVEDRPALLCNPREGDEWLLRLTDALVQGLAGLTKRRLKAVARRWSETEELQAAGWAAKDAVAVIEALGDLARKAAEGKKNVYVWMRL